ncbi:dTDP-4-dehydrorhamnose 3,5-epimerase [Polymorphum gilvum]|uniref:dTDP-4-dehydrorhamnose 3,5-epimerase n=1 Tax=Polymorphum gilvum (strain LMG 25793 / CGMCC 1.9160 / SL003B-26A1) TaxID=991905 RepID=F2IVG6_POLGS|nr:dTDP-4-dehydrorhamnose 3,5-epimerase [Polymorphum gilvum]ADZ72684.1 dTDP-4-dehydrorhamnose 3,5-epimerase, putative [Polymorphum gilvum SL003B-26A1]
MDFLKTELDPVVEIRLSPRRDDRGAFTRLFCAEEFRAAGLAFALAQSNLSESRHRHTLRGMHFQYREAAETKIVFPITGRIFDVALDLRAGSPSFGRWVGRELSADRRNALVIPKGFAHGFLTLEPDTHVMYLVDAPYNGATEGGVRWDDPQFAIDWPHEPAVISDRDRAHPDFSGSAL